jgi:MoaA/NifB/PqqE/SkfB family radical SAM enzyme
MNTFCVLPWYSSELPRHSPCCLLPIGTDIKQLQSDLKAGVKSIACTKCWTVEAQGQKSRRQFENEFLDYKLNRDIISLRQDCVDSKHETLLYQLTTSNLCNQACVSCSSNFSSKWAEIEKKIGLTTSPRKEINLENSNINYSTAKRISFLGGEPFFDSKTFEILQKLLDHNNQDCFISLVTNGSIALKQKQSDLLSKFSDLNICISIDGIDKKFEYLRWPAKWNMLLDNLKKYQDITKNISISYTISSLNALYYDETTEWFNKNNLRYNHNIVFSPNWLSLKNMPVEFKQHLSKNKNFINNYCNINGKEISTELIKSQIIKQDVAKKINICDYMPRAADLLGIL